MLRYLSARTLTHRALGCGPFLAPATLCVSKDENGFDGDPGSLAPSWALLAFLALAKRPS